MKTALFVGGLLVALCVLHLVASWMEQRGWISYIRRKPTPTSLGAALLELHCLGAQDVPEAVTLSQKEKPVQSRMEPPVSEDRAGLFRPRPLSSPTSSTQPRPPDRAGRAIRHEGELAGSTGRSEYSPAAVRPSGGGWNGSPASGAGRVTIRGCLAAASLWTT
jgi:hypothetical protein